MRFNDRDFEILSWMIYLKHLNRFDFRDAFFEKSTNPRRYPYRKLLKFMEAGYVTTTKISVEAKDLYLPTEKAAKLLRDEAIPHALGLSKDKEFANYRHDRVLIRLWILFKALQIGIYVPERVIRSIKPRGACPDAVIVTQKAAYAIEYERTEKTLERYKEIFERYRYREHYDVVLYITESRSIIEKIEEKFWDLENVYFITREELFAKKEEAIFRFQNKTLPLKQLIRESWRGSLKDLDRGFLKKIISPKPDESWKDEKPYTPWPKGGGGKNDDGGGGNEEDYGDSSVDPPVDLPLDGDGETNDEDDEFF